MVNYSYSIPAKNWTKKILATGFFISPFLFQNTVSLASELKPAYMQVSEDSEDVVNSDSSIRSEEHSILELIQVGSPFLHQYPTNIMSAAQILYSMILDQGVETKVIKGYGPISVYNFFSGSEDKPKNKRIIGQYEGIKAVVSGIETQAKGSDTGAKVPLLVGTHGTGKSEFRSVVANYLRHNSRHVEKYHFHEISWRVGELKNIPGVKNFINICQEQEFRSPLHSSPISILPKGLRKEIDKVAREVMNEQLSTSFPLMEMSPDPQSAYIRNEIIKYYTETEDEYTRGHLDELGIEKKASGKFSEVDEVKILDRYVTIRRVILGDPGTVPLIDAQGQDVDYSGLIMSENPIIRSVAGPSHPFSWNYNGALLTGNRNFVFLDEFFRNDQALRDTFLGPMQSRVISLGGVPPVPLDAVMIAATNSASINKALSSNESDAQVNRTRQIPFEWATNPIEIAEILLHMNGSGMKMQELNQVASFDGIEEAEHEYEDMNLFKLFPEARPGQALETSDGRYKLMYGEEGSGDEVFISPHTIMYMADFIAMTRMNVSSKDAQALKGAEQIIGDPMFSDHIMRLKFLKNEIPSLDSQQRELYQLSKRLKEGSFGLSARVAGTWLSESIIEARQEGNDHTLTPIILRKVYDRLANDSSLECSDLRTQQRWKSLMDIVSEGVLIPKLERDLFSSFHNDDKASEIYNEFILEIITLSQDPDATTYEGINGQVNQINKERMSSIEEIYKEKTGRPLAIQKISSFFMMQSARDSQNPKKDQDLLNAISGYIASSLGALISISDFLEYSEKDTAKKDIVDKFNAVKRNLKNKLGYNDRSITDALRITKQYKEKKEH